METLTGREKQVSLFAYGTLTIPAVMGRVAGCTFAGHEALLMGYACRLIRGEAFPGAIPEEGAVTQGLVYHGVDLGSLALLDSFEGSLYERRVLPVILKQGIEMRAHVYVLKGEHAHLLTGRPWIPGEFVARHLDAFLDSL